MNIKTKNKRFKKLINEVSLCVSLISFLLAMKIKMIVRASIFQSRSKTRKVSVKDPTLLLLLSLFQAFVDRWRYNAKRASLAQSRLKALEKL